MAHLNVQNLFQQENFDVTSSFAPRIDFGQAWMYDERCQCRHPTTSFVGTLYRMYLLPAENDDKAPAIRLFGMD
jgi:hypothetical protein